MPWPKVEERREKSDWQGHYTKFIEGFSVQKTLTSVYWLCELFVILFLNWCVRNIRQESTQGTKIGHKRVKMALRSPKSLLLVHPNTSLVEHPL